VCVAGFRYDTLWQPDWIRLFPFRVRDVPLNLRVHKWDVIRLLAKKNPRDGRPESYIPNMDSIQFVTHLDSSRNWQARRALVDPNRFETMLQVLAEHEASGISLAVVGPGQILDVEVTSRGLSELEEARQKAEAKAAQGDLFSLDNREPLEPVPFDFHLVVQYPDEPVPRRLKIIDWEINQTFRKYRDQLRYPQPELRVRDRWLNDVCGAKIDPSFLLGNLHRFQDQWLLLGIVWPKRIL
jgi:hypothetical protein